NTQRIASVITDLLCSTVSLPARQTKDDRRTLACDGGNRGVRRIAELRYAGLNMPFKLNEMLQRKCYFFGTYFLEDYILQSWQTAAKGAKVILDVGATVGIYSLAALASRRDAIIHAFEPRLENRSPAASSCQPK